MQILNPTHHSQQRPQISLTHRGAGGGETECVPFSKNVFFLGRLGECLFTYLLYAVGSVI